MSRKRLTFSREFKLAAVKKVVEQGLSCCQVARDLEISDNLIRNWRKAFEADGTLQAGVNDSPSVDAELNRLREEYPKSIVRNLTNTTNYRVIFTQTTHEILPAIESLSLTCHSLLARACPLLAYLPDFTDWQDKQTFERKVDKLIDDLSR